MDPHYDQPLFDDVPPIVNADDDKVLVDQHVLDPLPMEDGLTLLKLWPPCGRQTSIVHSSTSTPSSVPVFCLSPTQIKEKHIAFNVFHPDHAGKATSFCHTFL